MASVDAASPTPCVCVACDDVRCHFRPIDAFRRALGARDVRLDVKFCGVCHSDLHHCAGHLRAPTYPCVPGHEIAGVVVAVGDAVTLFKVGDRCGVGCVVDACLRCAACARGDEHKCRRGMTATYGGNSDAHGRATTWPRGMTTMGGYATIFVVDERFGIKIPDGYPLEAAGPAMCAGVTTYDPMRRRGVGPGATVGIVGLGGLGVMAVKIARAMGARVVVVSRREEKRRLALACGATDFIRADDADAAARCARHPRSHPQHRPRRARLLQVILGLHDGLVAGFLREAARGASAAVVASAIGGIPATRACVELCAAHRIIPELRVEPASRLADIYQALDSGNDDGVRYVVDVAAFAVDVDATRDALRARGPPVLDRVGRTVFSCFGVLRELARGCYVHH